MGCCNKKKPIVVGTLILIAITLVTSSAPKHGVSKSPQTASQAPVSRHHINGIGTLEQSDLDSRLWVQALAHEPHATPLRQGQTAIVTLRSTGKQRYAGILRRISTLNQYLPEEKLLYVTVENLPKTAAIGDQAEVMINLP